MTSLIFIPATFASLTLAAQTSVPTPVISADFSIPPGFNVRNSQSAQACHTVIRFVRDSLQQYVLKDTIYIDEYRAAPDAVIRNARQCLEGFPIATFDTLELRTAMDIALLTGDTVPIRAIVERVLSIRTSLRDRADFLLTVLNRTQKELQPVSLPFLRSLLAQLDAFGAEALAEQALGRYAVAESYRQRGTSPDSMLAISQDAFAAFQRASAAKLPVMEVGRRGSGALLGTQRHIAWYTYLRDLTRESFQKWSDLNATSAQYGVIGQLAPAITGEFWIGPHVENGTPQVTPPSPGRVPFPGSITLVAGFGTGAEREGQNWDVLRRIHQQFPSVRIILLTQTAGVAWGKVRIDDPAKEAELLGQLYLDSLKLPVWLNVSKTIVDTTQRNAQGVPAIFSSSTFESWGYTAIANLSNKMYVLDQQGYVVNGFAVRNINELAYVLERLLKTSESPLKKRTE